MFTAAIGKNLKSITAILDSSFVETYSGHDDDCFFTKEILRRWQGARVGIPVRRTHEEVLGMCTEAGSRNRKHKEAERSLEKRFLNAQSQNLLATKGFLCEGRGMDIFVHIKLFLANLSLAAVVFSGQATVSSLKSAARHATAKNVEINVAGPQGNQSSPPQRIVLTNKTPEITTSTKTFVDEKGEAFEVGNKNPFKKPPRATASASPKPSPQSGSATAGRTPKPTPSPKSSATITPTQSPVPQPTPQATSIPAPSPDFTVGTLLIGNNPAYTKTGAAIRFSVFVRDADERVIKNKALTFLVNGQALTASTDETGNAFLEIQAPLAVGDFKIILQLGPKIVSFIVNVIDSKPVLSLSSFAFDIEGYSVRLRNAAGEAVPNWQVTAYKRDGSILGIKTTSELGATQFNLPPREDGGHMYACAEVKDVGRQCTSW